MVKIHTARQFGYLIRTTRKENHITQRNLAAVSGTGVRFIQELEKGKSTCELGKALHVARMLGINIKAMIPESKV